MAHQLLIIYTMQSLNRHILVLGRLFLAIFIVANSGFSVALTYCAMSDTDACSMATANSDDQNMSGTCDDHASPSQANREVAFSQNDPCMLTTVAGGLQTDPTTVEKQSAARNVLEKLADLAFDAPVLVSNQLNGQNFSLFSPSTTNVSPPSVEKYVLNATFLI